MVCLNPVQFISLLKLKLSHLWPVGASSNWLVSPFGVTLIVPDNFLTFCYDKIFYTYLVFPAPDLESAAFLKDSAVSSLFLKLQNSMFPIKKNVSCSYDSLFQRQLSCFIVYVIEIFFKCSDIYTYII